MKLKTHKSISKRFKITGSGKILKRTCGQDHFNTRESGNITRAKRRDREISKTHRKIIAQYT
ncbi:MAG: 50S ribosomal protein L35 [Parcubacteria group bacterium CG_4_10_14_0_8_um_filter_35_7]|nr:MAG: 50S ribosomal protein L35 [Parcubacteria group bacterium CG23_combo_of_CG06-09_8_20_14_all_35_9]PIY78460.1 MAG: 50S ribosomal protein L35 [Parcubacteria group bacterium CG_4_10_14_0_8_um_filter_35_7]